MRRRNACDRKRLSEVPLSREMPRVRLAGERRGGRGGNCSGVESTTGGGIHRWTVKFFGGSFGRLAMAAYGCGTCPAAPGRRWRMSGGMAVVTYPDGVERVDPSWLGWAGVPMWTDPDPTA